MSSTKKEFDPLSGVFVDPKTRPPAPPAGPDPKALAKMLAKAAAAKAGAPSAAPGRAPPPGPAKPPAPTPAKGIAGAPPPKRALSAAEALEAARKAAEAEDAERRRKLEEARRVAAEARARLAAPPPPRAIPAAVVIETPVAVPVAPPASPIETAQALLATRLPGAQLAVATAMYADERKLLTVLWKAHRGRFLAAGDLDHALAADAVLIAASNLGPRELLAATVSTVKGDWLLWMDLRQHQVIAAFANARAWMAGLEPNP